MVGNPAIAVITDAYVKGNPWFRCPESSGVLRKFDEKIRKRRTGDSYPEFIRNLEYAYFDWLRVSWKSRGDPG